MVRFAMSLIVLALALVAVTTALEPADNFRDGACLRLPLRNVESQREVLDSFKYFTGLNKYNLYSMASTMPNYSSMREDELYYDGCFTRNGTTATGPVTGVVFGFGGPRLVLQMDPVPGYYFIGTPVQPPMPWNILAESVTLTDNKNFVVLVQCWRGVNQRGFAVLSRTPVLDPRSQRIIENHLLQLGFKRENFAFPKFDSCRQGFGNPSL